MKNPDYDATAFALQSRVYTRQLAVLNAQMETFTRQLEDREDAYYPYATDHADERLGHLSRELHALADRLESLRKYANYTPTC